MTFSEPASRSLNAFFDLSIIPTELLAHPLCPTWPLPHFPLLPSHCLSSVLSLSFLLFASVFLIPLDIGGA